MKVNLSGLYRELTVWIWEMCSCSGAKRSLSANPDVALLVNTRITFTQIPDGTILIQEEKGIKMRNLGSFCEIWYLFVLEVYPWYFQRSICIYVHLSASIPTKCGPF